MLIRFGLENHRSIRDYQQLLMTAAPFKERSEVLIGPSDLRLSLLPSVAIYGANASGKSTVLHAVRFMQSLIRDSHTRGSPGGGMPRHPFGLDDACPARSSQYDIDVILDETRFHYGFRIDDQHVIEEWVYAIALNRARRTRQTWFHRKENEPVYFGKELRGENKLIEKITRNNSLFLSAAAQNAHPQLTRLHTFLCRQMIVQEPLPQATMINAELIQFFGQNPHLEEKVADFLGVADIGITRIGYEDVSIDNDAQKQAEALFEAFDRVFPEPLTDVSPKNRRLFLWHKGAGGKEYAVDLRDESAGTLALMTAIGPIFKVLEEGGVLVADELSNTLHPLLSRKIVELFNDRSINRGNAQLVFTTHDTNLLCDGLFRRDQVWFTEKDSAGATHLYPLSDIQVDKRDNLKKGYLQGRFGAVPFFADIDQRWVKATSVMPSAPARET